MAKDHTAKARAYHNLGNALYQKGQFKESVEAYKNALRQNPNDLETKRNLTNALHHFLPHRLDNRTSRIDKATARTSKTNSSKTDNSRTKEKRGRTKETAKPTTVGGKGAATRPSKQEAKELLEINKKSKKCSKS